MTDDRLRRIALLLQSLDDCDREKAEFLTAHKDQRTRLENELSRLKQEILSGQDALPLEAAS